MISPLQFYEENLYPLQDGVMNTISRCGTRFFLTGGTALSRAYYHHRYSDDLDFFVNADAEYAAQMDLIFDKLRGDGFFGTPSPALSVPRILFRSKYGGINRTQF
jgi:hypothetical protein